MNSGQLIYDSPIGPTQPNGSGVDFFGTVRDFASGAFNFGLEYLSDKLAFERQKDLLKWQQEVNGYADMTNSGQGMPRTTINPSSYSLGQISPVVIAAMGVLLILVIKD